MKKQKVTVGDRVFAIEPLKVEELISWLENNTKEIIEEDELVIDIEDTKGAEIVFDESTGEENDEDPSAEEKG